MGEFSFIAAFMDSRFFDFWLLNAAIVLTRKNKISILFFQTITAEDNGGKSNSATVNIKVEDVNDQSPEFNQTFPYSFRVSEGEIDAIVGMVEAKGG